MLVIIFELIMTIIAVLSLILAVFMKIDKNSEKIKKREKEEINE